MLKCSCYWIAPDKMHFSVENNGCMLGVIMRKPGNSNEYPQVFLEGIRKKLILNPCHAEMKMPLPLLIFSQSITWSRLSIQIHIPNDKQCRSRSVGFFRSQLIWIYSLQRQGISGFTRTRVNIFILSYTILHISYLESYLPLILGHHYSLPYLS